MVKSLKKILGKVEFKINGPKDVSIKGITQDSREVKKGFLFVAVRGSKVNGHDFIEEAIEKGAKVIVGENHPEKAWLNSITYVKVNNSQNVLGIIASNWYENPSKKLKVIGVTGTDGKTTTASLIYHILLASGLKAGLVSTLAAKIGDKVYDTGLHVTNPDPITLQSLLAKMVDNKAKYAVLEVTSHGIEQKRIAGTDFYLNVLTNISHEHLDYHGTFNAYRDVKINFVLSGEEIVTNKDDKSYDYLAKKARNKKVTTYSISKEADLNASEIKRKDKRMEFSLKASGKLYRIRTNLPGEYNVANVLAAFSTINILGISFKEASRALLSFKAPKGRLEKVDEGQDFDVYIDFAHTPNSLRSVLTYLKEVTKGRLITVFGCAGERDTQKRYLMGKVAGELSDISIFTAEDPRREDIFDIMAKMASGANAAYAREVNSAQLGAHSGKNNVFFRVPQRGEAIALAIQKVAKKNDSVVIAGKGHEKSMAYGSWEHPWSDRKAVVNALKPENNLAAIVLAAGLGKRIKSRLPKVLHKIAGWPMLDYTLQILRAAKLSEIVVVVGYKRELVEKNVGGAVKFALQENAKGGTAQASEIGLKKVSLDKKYILVLYGDDSAFYKAETIKAVVDSHKRTNAVLSFVTLIKTDPTGLGRIVRDGSGRLLGIVEEKDATEAQRKIKEINDGLYVFNRGWLEKNLSRVRKSPVTDEYYLVDLIAIALKRKEKVNVFRLEDDRQWFGISTREQLAEAERKMEERLKKALEG